MDEFTVRMELYKGGRTYKKNLLLFSCSPLPVICWLPGGCTPIGKAFSKHRGGGWGAGAVVGFLLLWPAPQAFIINYPWTMSKV